ncbi:MAG: hypothetical protein LBM69_01105 [Lachnospiraceae bacterium]|jgi:hypothetical protein|nr:hypothetical protein [Lachnospiraceae bacterium]
MQKQPQPKTWSSWSRHVLLSLGCILLLIAVMMILVDPYMHYHKPLSGLSFNFPPQRYGSDGIEKNFSYDAILLGNSLAENFKTSEFDALFDTHAVKLIFSGSYLQEMSMNLQNSFAYNDDIHVVLWSINYPYLLFDADLKAYSDTDYPTYLYDDNPFNDVHYLYNSFAIARTLHTLFNTVRGKEAETFDDYSAWSAPTGREAILQHYTRIEKTEPSSSDVNTQATTRTLAMNILPVIEAHPNTRFILFFPPYSIIWWDEAIRRNTLQEFLQGENVALTTLLSYDNVEVYCFHEAIDIYSDLNHYSDILHYNATINSWILNQIHAGKYRITPANQEEHLNHVREILESYEYDAIYEQ